MIKKRVFREAPTQPQESKKAEAIRIALAFCFGGVGSFNNLNIIIC
ncbi:hypothetical protein G8J22_02143 [Lentilactobacillus hilgardii]|uniref:Uncharacterized protein n=1 Tax=Lentilactobacillus hilgardii (strain ATCC 8290 / DSM 20176 / CCUG 30140 / JCM 1155 / KCTC 3500 / NBRC 15886 / NCIMB 8040 / NRRL B-1843 / 9) TaxID=1423757 RepID=C0XHD8_LENH9|nr:hypothetical protein HMPREF0497_1868 [Lentilactobacillus buchneri ATCC 11577]EEI25210.1 hypothetical protein HMPREF0519_0578 [Lentilactobacillus hilgardii DSM 20176 = ATCC 8290]QIR10136.1 hypothetical protein G8J22_02143 [Lentilactobacillus hilgardii]